MPEDIKPELLSIGSASSSKIPRYELIPKEALVSLALRCEKGIERHGEEKAWNAISSNRRSALTKEWVLARLAHVIDHALDAIQHVNNGTFNEEDDAGALMFAGAVLACYNAEERKRSASQPWKYEIPKVETLAVDSFFVPPLIGTIPSDVGGWLHTIGTKIEATCANCGQQTSPTYPQCQHCGKNRQVNEAVFHQP